MAQRLAKNKLAKGNAIECPSAAFIYLQVLMSRYEREIFGSLFLDTKNRVISFDEIFHGTINVANIHPREVVKRALVLNAAAVILVHNHPSGDPSPSDADKKITIELREALKLIDVAVIDHIVVGTSMCVSMRELGLL